MNTVERLIDFFVPNHYDLVLKINQLDKTFEGAVTVVGQSTKDGGPVKLHAKNLTITGASIDQVPATFTQGKHDELAVTIDNLAAGEHTVIVNFSGIITDHMHGLYPCYYKDGDVQKVLFATQFESHHAREVFPCIDEPAAKATFDLSLTTDSGQTVLSNMPVRLQTENEDHLVTSFETTPRMSTYLLAFAIGDLQRKVQRRRVESRSTFTQPSHSQQVASILHSILPLGQLTSMMRILRLPTRCQRVITLRFRTFHPALWRTGALSPIASPHFLPIQKIPVFHQSST